MANQMEYAKGKLWIVLVIAAIFCIQPGDSQITDLNTPPVMYVDRNWRISESEPLDSILTRVRAEDAERDQLVFGLEPLRSGYPSNLNENNEEDWNPFRINPQTGVVYLNSSLAGRGGENFFIYVTVSDGTLTAKNEVYVNILADNNNNTSGSSLYSPLPPSFTPNTKNISQLLPPFHLLPGVQQNHKTNTNNGLPKSPHQPLTYPTYHQKNTYPDPTNRTESNRDNDENDSFNTNNNNHHNNGDNNDDRHKKNPSKVTTTVLRPVSGSAGGGGAIHPGAADKTNNGTNQTATQINQNANTLTSMMPIVIGVASIFLVAGVVALLVFRKHLCAISKSLKSKSKEEMAKKSNQSNISSSNLTVDDCRDSMVMQHWNGPLAFNNRYVPWEREHQHNQATSQLSTGSTSTSKTHPQVQYDRWEFPRHRLKFFNILGEGAFGQVWRCEATEIDGNEGVTTVAVKTLKENATELERNDLQSELQVMKSLEPHVNVVRLLGCCTEKDPLFVIIEYVNKGKLQSYLRSSRAERHYGNTHGKSNVLTSGDLTSFMYQVARGMDFLTSRGIIHRDLAARNILITDDHTCKVADFGFARDVITSKVYERKSEGKLPIRWMAIESLYDNIFSVKSDIWSFGILMWEIVTLGSTPYPGIAAADVMRKVRDGYRLEKPDHCRRELYNIMYYCWSKDPNERPSFCEIVQLLDKLLLTEMDYIELERFPDHNYYNMLSLSGEKL